ncbi:MAG: sigma 54-interacting transcriptional regulator [Vicinamibacterales bacterium]
MAEPLRTYLQRVVEQCGARSGSVFVSTPWNSSQPAILLHSTDAPAVPELDSPDDALAFTAQEFSGGTPAAWSTTPRPSRDDTGVLLPIPLITTLWQRVAIVRDLPDEALRQFRRQSDRDGQLPVAGWIGLAFDTPLRRSPNGDIQSWPGMLELSSILASTYVCLYGVLTDPLTGLPGRAELPSLLRAELERARAQQRPYALALINAGGLDAVNERLGRRAGDAAIREVVLRLQQLVRRSDPLLRYGGAIFALSLSDVASDSALVVGEKIRRHLSETAFLDGQVTLDCHVGLAIYEPGRDDAIEPLDLVRRADLAVAAARRASGRRVFVWRHDTEPLEAVHLDRLLGVFTGNVEKDYRNMGVLWNALATISVTTDPEALAQAVVERLFELLRPSRVAIFDAAPASGPRLLAGLEHADGGNGRVVLTQDGVSTGEWQLTERTCQTRQPETGLLVEEPAAQDRTGREPFAFSVPLLSGDRTLGTIYIAGSPDRLKLDRSDLPFLAGFASQIAIALDRAQLAERERASEERERRALKAELQDLRSALQQAKLVYRAPAMTELLSTTRRVAPTDTTVLITGESGTGKELLANTLHQLSPRRQKPFVIVDCGAIPSTLIESELFGRERGAFTGAQQRAIGRLAQADGGTVLLDEIGELPLDVQAKLLRFVQEKQLTMVGGTRAQRVDVRIVAATNRQLEEEVKAGRFRQDLFYRLNVVRLRIPPLRERPEDVLYLARHFLEVFAVQYQKAVRRFTDEAEAQLTAYDWPGNVREIQNRVLQAVVLAEGTEITPDDMKLPLGESMIPVPVSVRAAPAPWPPPRHAEASAQGGATGRSAIVDAADAMSQFRQHLRTVVESTQKDGRSVPMPLGRWLAHDVILEAHEAAGQVIARGAALTGVPETTFARRLRQATADAAVSRRPDGWPDVRAALGALVRATGRTTTNLLDLVEQVLLEEVLRVVPHRATDAAQLLALSLPTFRRRLAAQPLAS